MIRRAASILGRSLAGAAGVVLVGLVAGHLTGRIETVVALSGSMSPSFSAGDMLIETPQATDTLRVGEILTYHMPIGDHHVESHRIVWVRHLERATLVRTRGDANAVDDPWTARLTAGESWRVRTVVPFVGRIVPILDTPLTRLLAIVSLMLVPLSFAVGRIWRIA
ncbi:MAG TPA: signal peptidase I [Gaiellales bacterium]|jgi:signal peptidase